MRRVLLGSAWVLSVGVAFWIGRGEAPERCEAPPAARVHRAERAPAAGSLSAPAAAWLAARLGGSAPAEVEDSELMPAPVLERRDAFTLDGITSAEEASTRFMSFVATKLDEGPDGHLEILRTMDRELRNAPKLQAMIPDDRAAARLAYPWIKFLLGREGDVLAAMETVYRTAAESPEALEGMNDETLGLVTHGLATLLPGAVPEETLERFRELARQGIARADEVHEGLRGDLKRDLERNLEHWAKPVTSREAYARIERGDVDPREMADLLGRLEPKDLSRIDPVSLLRPLLASPRYGSINALARFDLDAQQVARLDAELLEALSAADAPSFSLDEYLRATRRVSWQEVEPLYERAFARSPELAGKLGWTLLSNRYPPDPDFVRRALARHTFPDPLARALREKYQLD